MGLCLPPKGQQRRGGPDLRWQTVPRPRRSRRKGAVAKSYCVAWNARDPLLGNGGEADHKKSALPICATKNLFRSGSTLFGWKA